MVRVRLIGSWSGIELDETGQSTVSTFASAVCGERRCNVYKKGLFLMHIGSDVYTKRPFCIHNLASRSVR